MRKSKRTFHCERCGNPCAIYKKGKKHRVLVCPQHGIIATNPLPLLAMAASAAPSLIKGAARLFGGKKKDAEMTASAPIPRSPADRYTTEERVRDALE